MTWYRVHVAGPGVAYVRLLLAEDGDAAADEALGPYPAEGLRVVGVEALDGRETVIASKAKITA